MANRELPTIPPRPLAYLLPKAIGAFISHGCDRFKMVVPAWGNTFHVEPDDVRAEWEKQMSIKSQSPNNAFEVEGK